MACSNQSTISQLISKLRDSFKTSEFDSVEETLVATEATMKREFDKERKEWEEKVEWERRERVRAEEEGKVWNRKYEKLLENNEELQRRNTAIGIENMRVLKELEGQVSQLENAVGANKLMKDFKGMSDEGGVVVKEDGGNNNRKEEPVIDLETDQGTCRDPKEPSGIGNASKDDIVIIDSDDDDGCLASTPGAEMHKRKRAPPSPSNVDEDFTVDHIQISEIIKQDMEISLAQKADSSGVGGHGNHATSTSCHRVNLRQSEEAKRKSSPYQIYGLLCDSESDDSTSSTSEDSKEFQNLMDDILGKANR